MNIDDFELKVGNKATTQQHEELKLRFEMIEA
jgi:hypothetical protein